MSIEFTNFTLSCGDSMLTHQVQPVWISRMEVSTNHSKANTKLYCRYTLFIGDSETCVVCLWCVCVCVCVTYASLWLYPSFAEKFTRELRTGTDNMPLHYSLYYVLRYIYYLCRETYLYEYVVCTIIRVYWMEYDLVVRG